MKQLSSLPVERILELIPKFFSWADRDVIKAGHQFGTGAHSFVMRYRQLDADMTNPDRHREAAIVTARMREADKSATTEDAAMQAIRMMRERSANGAQ